MTKFVLAGGYVHKAPDGGKAFCEELVKGFKNRVNILLCPFAREKSQWQEYLNFNQEFFSKNIINFELKLADEKFFIEQVKDADVVYIGGGNTKFVLDNLQKLKEWTQYIEDKIIAGTSAGAEAIAQYYCVAKNGRIGEGIGLLPVKFSPHWLATTGEYESVNWEERMDLLKAYKEELPMVLLKEGEFKVFNQ